MYIHIIYNCKFIIDIYVGIYIYMCVCVCVCVCVSESHSIVSYSL